MKNAAARQSVDSSSYIWPSIICAIFITSLIPRFLFLLKGGEFAGVDDANIYFTYSKNFWESFAVKFHPNYPVVEGSTSFLWFVITTIFFKIFGSFVEESLFALNIIFSCLVVFLTFKIFLLNSEKKPEAIVLASLVSIITFIPIGFADWAIFSLMETGLWSLLIFTTGIHIISRQIEKSDSMIFTMIQSEKFYLISTVLLVLTRPEAMMIAPSFAILKIITELRFNKSLRISQAVGYILFCLTPILLLMIYRYLYFGYPFPNTYYAKVNEGFLHNFSEGTKYILGYLKSNKYFIVGVLLTFLFATWDILKNKRNKKIESLLFNAICFMFFCFFPIVYSGGDHFGHWRFIQPFVPLFALNTFLLFNQTSFSYRKISFFLFCSLNLMFIGRGIKKLSSDKTILHEFEIATKGRNQGIIANKFFKELPELPTWGRIPVGGVSFTYKGYINDLVGLNNPEMAHSKKIPGGFKGHDSFNPTVFLDQAPDFFEESINMTRTPNQVFSPLALSVYKDVFSMSRFSEMYSYAKVEVGSNYIEAFFKKSFLNRLQTKWSKTFIVSELEGYTR